MNNSTDLFRITGMSDKIINESGDILKSRYLPTVDTNNYDFALRDRSRKIIYMFNSDHALADALTSIDTCEYTMTIKNVDFSCTRGKSFSEYIKDIEFCMDTCEAFFDHIE